MLGWYDHKKYLILQEFFFISYRFKCLHSWWFLFIIPCKIATLYLWGKSVDDFVYLKFQWIWKLLSFDISYFSVLPKMINFFIPYIWVRCDREISSHALDENFSFPYKYFGLYDLWLSFFSFAPLVWDQIVTTLRNS